MNDHSRSLATGSRADKGPADKDRLHSACESAAAQKIVPSRQLNDSEFAQAGD